MTSNCGILSPDYSTTRLFTCEPPSIKEPPEATLKTVLFLPEGEGRQGEGGLRTQGYFKHSLPGKPLITVITVVFNGEKYLEETILSVINQTYDNVEYIIIDGGSGDGTLDIIKNYENQIDYWVSGKDRGIYDAMNKGIDLTTGEWVNFMNGGDRFYTPSVISEIFTNKSQKDTQIFYGNHQVIYSNGRTRLFKAGLVKDLWKGSQFCHQTSFVRSRYHKAHKFNLCTPIVADFEFFYKAWKVGVKFEFIDIVIAKFNAGGVSDVRRIDSILGWWFFVDKSLGNNLFYCYLVFKESLKKFIKDRVVKSL